MVARTFPRLFALRNCELDRLIMRIAGGRGRNPLASRVGRQPIGFSGWYEPFGMIRIAPWPRVSGHNSFLRSQLSMSTFKSVVAVILCYLVALPVFGQTPEIAGSNDRGFLYGLTRNYRPTAVPKISFEDSPRLEKLM